MLLKARALLGMDTDSEELFKPKTKKAKRYSKSKSKNSSHISKSKWKRKEKVPTTDSLLKRCRSIDFPIRKNNFTSKEELKTNLENF